MKGESTGVICEVSTVLGGNWFIQLDDWYLVELYPVGQTRLVAFLTSFDVVPIELCIMRIRSHISASSLRFAGGIEFEGRTWLDKIIATFPGYSEEVIS